MVQFPTVGQPEKPQDITGPKDEVEQQKSYDKVLDNSFF